MAVDRLHRDQVFNQLVQVALVGAVSEEVSRFASERIGFKQALLQSAYVAGR